MKMNQKELNLINRLRDLNNKLVSGVSEIELLELEKEYKEIFEMLKSEGKKRANTLKS